MRLANVDGRAVVVTDHGVVDVATVSQGRYGPSVLAVLDDWSAFRSEAPELVESVTGEELDPVRLGPPVPDPRQVFGIGLNYRSHVEESGRELPTVPATFTKFPACLTGPFAEVELSGPSVDWEVELVVVIGTRCDRVDVSDAWDHVAGLTVGQDLSDRTMQFAAGAQFSLGKSYRGYGPTGPWLVTPDEFADPDDVELTCSLNGEEVQRGRTADLVFSVPSLIAQLSAVVALLPGDLIFTGTPDGVGVARTPPRFLAAEDVLESHIDGIGSMRTVFGAASSPSTPTGEQ